MEICCQLGDEMLPNKSNTLSDWKSENKMSAAELVIELIEYYSDFNYLKYAIHIGKGCTLPR